MFNSAYTVKIPCLIPAESPDTTVWDDEDLRDTDDEEKRAQVIDALHRWCVADSIPATPSERWENRYNRNSAQPLFLQMSSREKRANSEMIDRNLETSGQPTCHVM